MKRPSTKQYVESLKNHIGDLDAYVTLLESRLAKCHEEHGDVTESHLHSRPVMISFLSSTETPPQEEERVVDIDSATNSDQDADIDQLVAPTKHLVVSGFMLAIVYIISPHLRWSILASRFRSSIIWPDIYFSSRIKGFRA